MAATTITHTLFPKPLSFLTTPAPLIALAILCALCATLPLVRAQGLTYTYGGTTGNNSFWTGNNAANATDPSPANILSVTGTMAFQRNTCEQLGGAILFAGVTSNIVLSGSILFDTNGAASGGAVTFANSGNHSVGNTTLSGDILFIANTASVAGGAIDFNQVYTGVNYAPYATLDGLTRFITNHSGTGSGGAIYDGAQTLNI